ncbi:MAG: qseC [Gammaproteobacteria bacterium]|jgi:two-component system sensor histidine kinase QseC|nr:qseC [Gammaproteobacteria bacterium]
MIHSIRRFLFISLILAITVASSIIAIGNYLLDKQIIQPYLDEQLIDHLILIKKLNTFVQLKVRKKNAASVTIDPPNLIYQIWDNNKLLLDLLNHSPTSFSLKNAPPGFSDLQIHNHDWRVYADIDRVTGKKIVVAQPYTIRNKLTDLIARNNSYMALLTYPIFAIFIWLIINTALRSMTHLTHQISHRAPAQLDPINSKKIPIEIKPLVDELNRLLEYLKLMFERNKSFVADTAHELRTPLAALKTQAQVALKAHNEAAHQNALAKVMQGVDRCSHIITQLLTLSSLSQEETFNDMHPINLHKLTKETLINLVPAALEKNIDIELGAPPIPCKKIIGNDIILSILIRNLVDNAIRYTPSQGAVSIVIMNTNDAILLRVTDTGLGIPRELHERVFDRFYRVLGTTQTGSGLGLAIAKQIAKLHHAQINLSTPQNGMGLQIDVLFPLPSLNNRETSHSLKKPRKRRKR